MIKKSGVLRWRFYALHCKFLLTLCFLSFANQSAYPLEKIGNEYIISTAVDLETFAAMVYNGDSAISCVLVNDITYINHSSNIGNFFANKPFCGTFDGAGHTMTIQISLLGNEISLCQYLAHGGTIKNLNLKGTLSTCGYSSASLVGHMEDGIVSNCMVSVDISSDRPGDMSYGGLVGTTHGNCLIRNCMYQGSFTNPRGCNVAGLVGRVCAPGTVIEDCMSICDFQVHPSDEVSNAVLITDSMDWVTLRNVSYRGICTLNHPELHEIPSDGRLDDCVYEMWGKRIAMQEREIVESDLRAKQKMIDEEDKVENIFTYFITESVIMAILIIICVIYYQQNKLHKVELLNLKTNMAQQEIIWENKVHELQKALKPDSSEEEQAKNAIEALFQKLVRIMEEQELYKDPDLDETKIARALCTNNNQISKCVNMVSGKSLKFWLATYRIKHATALIREMEKNGTFGINTVIEQSGYSSRSTFYRQFKKVTGITPYQIKYHESPLDIE